MDNTVHGTYLIPTSRVESLDKTITRLANKINKGKTHADFPPTMVVVKEVVMVHDNGRSRLFSPTTVYSKKAEYVPYTWVEIKYQRPILNGWTLVCVYDWELTDDGKRTCYVSPVPGQMVPPEFRNVESTECDHCNAKRYRKQSYLVTKNFLDFQVVGSTCLKDFLGHRSPKSFIDVFSFELALRSYQDEFVFGGDATNALIPVLDTLEVAAMMIRKYGYVKAKDYDGLPTGNRVSSYLFPYTDDEKRWAAANQPTDKDCEIGQETSDWILEQDTGNDYMDTLNKCISAGAISHRRLNILVSSVIVYQRAMDKVREDSIPKANEHVGAVKERLRMIDAIVTRVHHGEGYNGDYTVINLISIEGNTFVWFASGYKEIDSGEHWLFDGTVKEHDEFRGTKQTKITRVKYDLLNQAECAA